MLALYTLPSKKQSQNKIRKANLTLRKEKSFKHREIKYKESRLNAEGLAFWHSLRVPNCERDNKVVLEIRSKKDRLVLNEIQPYIKFINLSALVR